MGDLTAPAPLARHRGGVVGEFDRRAHVVSLFAVRIARPDSSATRNPFHPVVRHWDPRPKE